VLLCTAGLLYSFSQDTIRPGEAVTLTFNDTALLRAGTYTLNVVKPDLRWSAT